MKSDPLSVARIINARNHIYFSDYDEEDFDTIIAALALAERFGKAGRYKTEAGSIMIFLDDVEQSK